MIYLDSRGAMSYDTDSKQERHSDMITTLHTYRAHIAQGALDMTTTLHTCPYDCASHAEALACFDYWQEVFMTLPRGAHYRTAHIAIDCMASCKANMIAFASK